MSKKIKSEKYRGVYYVKKGSNSKDWIYYCKFRWRNKLYNYRNLTEEFSVTSEKQASEKISILKNEAKKALELGLPNPLERQKLRQIEKSKEIKKAAKRTINEHWEVFDADYKRKKSKHTYDLYSNFYNLYIKDELGEMYPSDVKSIHIDKVLFETSLKDTSDPYKSLLKRLLRPIFDKAIGDGEMTNSPIESYKFDLKLKPKRKKISRKTKLSHLEIARKIYNQIPKYISQYINQREEWQQLMYLQLLTGKRYGELFELTAENIDYENKRINSFEDISKTDIASSIPIPDECQDFILNIQAGKIFKEIKKGSYYGVFQRLKTNALGRELDFELTAHDTRSLFISTLSALGEDSRKVDYMLDHKQNTEEIIHFYLDLSQESCDKAFKRYWNALRNK